MPNCLPEYKRKILTPLVTSLNNVRIGDIILFRYSDTDMERLVWVISPKYQDKLHGIMLNEVLLVKYKELVRRIGPKMGTMIPSNNSVGLYQFVQPLIKQFDNYRSFDRLKIHAPIKKYSPEFHNDDHIITFPNGSIIIGEDHGNKVFLTAASYNKYVLPLLTTNCGVYYEGKSRRVSKGIENLLNATLLDWKLVTTWEPDIKKIDADDMASLGSKLIIFAGRQLNEVAGRANLNKAFLKTYGLISQAQKEQVTVSDFFHKWIGDKSFKWLQEPNVIEDYTSEGSYDRSFFTRTLNSNKKVFRSVDDSGKFEEFTDDAGDFVEALQSQLFPSEMIGPNAKMGKLFELQSVINKAREVNLLEMARTHRGIYFAGVSHIDTAKALISEG